MAYYYPEGYFGPICDAPISDEEIAARNRVSLPDPVDEFVDVYGPEEPWWLPMKELMGFLPRHLIGIRCKQKPDGTYYDCQYDFIGDKIPGDSFPGAGTVGLNDRFFVPKIGPESCSPFDSDINIRPTRFVQADGTIITKYKRERSKPVTYNVSAKKTSIPEPITVQAVWNADGTAITVTGNGSGNLPLKYTWDDNPSISGTVLDTITITDDTGEVTTWTQSGENGSETDYILVSAGTYTVNYNGMNGPSNRRRASDTLLEFDDDPPGSAAGTYPITVAAQGTNGRGINAALLSVSSDRIRWTDSTSQNDTDAELIIRSATGGASANFTGSNESNIALVITGTGTVELEFEWDDNPNVNGQAVGALSIDGQTYNQTGDEGDTTITFGGGGDFDINSTFEILPFDAVDFDFEESWWNEDGQKYGVWVNPEECTLPFEEQEVTYTIFIEQDGVYGFTFGSDDNSTVVLGDSDILFNNLPGGIFAAGTYSTPYTVTRNLTRGNIKVTVKCTNSAAGFVDAEGRPEGLAYFWGRNPGGWFLKICKGGPCSGSGASAAWVPSGPHQAWSSFMNAYAVYPSATLPLSGINHTATWNIDIPATDTYTLELQADNQATILLDGAQVATSGSFTSSTTASLSNLSVGAHTITATVTNQAPNAPVIDEWTSNPGGVAWTITRPGSTQVETVNTTVQVENDIQAVFNDNGFIIVTGQGTGEIQLIFEWDDNPNTNNTALGSISIAGKTFVQTAGVERGSDSYKFTAAAGQVYPILITNNSGGFSKQNDTKLCFRDEDGNDCNAELKISSVKHPGTFTTTTSETVTNNISETIVAKSTDIQQNILTTGNLIWHTRLASGYEYYQQ